MTCVLFYAIIHITNSTANERKVVLKKIKSLFELFLSMLKIGLFTFGGGYAMIGIFEREFVQRKGWLGSEEFMDLVTIAESTPGPIAINCSTYIGYKQEGLSGSIFATLGICAPMVSIIYVISLFFDRFLEITVVASAFRGIQACVIFLIFSAGLKLLRTMKKNVFNIVAVTASFVTFVTFSLLSVGFSSIFYILIFGLISLSVYSIGYVKSKIKKREDDK